MVALCATCVNLETVDLEFKGKFKDYKEPLLILKHDPVQNKQCVILQGYFTLQY